MKKNSRRVPSTGRTRKFGSLAMHGDYISDNNNVFK